MSELDDLTRAALRVHDLYDELNLKVRGRVWTREEFMLGDLAAEFQHTIAELEG